MEGRQAYGFYGKVPCVGDFVRRDLSQPFVVAWDRWMQNLLVAAREALGERWQACYLRAPIWHFALSPGECGPHAAAGVFMPSVDRVGRQFPLCLAAEIDAPAWTSYLAIKPFIDTLEDAALAMLEDNATLEQLERALGALPPPATVQIASAQRTNSATVLCTDGAIEDGLSALATAGAASIWIANLEGRGRVLLSPNLPEGKTEAAALFDLSARYWDTNN